MVSKDFDGSPILVLSKDDVEEMVLILKVNVGLLSGYRSTLYDQFADGHEWRD